MKLVVAHSFYRQRGGEDVVVEAEIDLLRAGGIEVQTFFRHNKALESLGPAAVAARTAWSSEATAGLDALLAQFKPDVVHVHNTFPAISPAIYWTCARRGVPVVQTLHNFRLLCVDATFLRAGAPCEQCLGGSLLPAVRHRCFNDSSAQSAVVAAAISLHRAIGSYRNKVSRYIALNEFSRARFIAGGLPAERIRIKPNFVADPVQRFVEQPVAGSERAGGLYVGRLSEEKGFGVLLQALAEGALKDLKVIGDGPMADAARAALGERWLGAMSSENVLDHMRRARYVVVPSICYEQFPRVIVEAFACATPVIASRLGALAELIEDRTTGRLFAPGDGRELATIAEQLDAGEADRLGRNARAVYEARYTPRANLDVLTSIYREAVEPRRVAELSRI